MDKKIKLINILKLIYFALIVVFVLGFVFLIKYKIILYVLAVYLPLIIGLYLAIHILRIKTYSYKCPSCNHVFKISLSKDIMSYNSGIGMKVLICPKCNTKEVMKEVIE